MKELPGMDLLPRLSVKTRETVMLGLPGIFMLLRRSPLYVSEPSVSFEKGLRDQDCLCLLVHCCLWPAKGFHSRRQLLSRHCFSCLAAPFVAYCNETRHNNELKEIGFVIMGFQAVHPHHRK